MKLRWIDPKGEHVAEDIRWRTWAANPEGITGEELYARSLTESFFQQSKNGDTIQIEKRRNAERMRSRLLMIRQCFTDMNNYMTNGTAMELINYIHANIEYDE